LSVYASREERKAKDTPQTDRKEIIETETDREGKIIVPSQTPDAERRTVGQGSMNDSHNAAGHVRMTDTHAHKPLDRA
jgi:hypothetical protein